MSLFKKIAGVILILIGIAAILTPLTPGSWLFILGGLALLGTEIDLSDDAPAGKWSKRLGIRIDTAEHSKFSRWAKRLGLKIKKKLD